MQNTGVRVTRSLRDKYRSLCKETKKAIQVDCNKKLELEAMELTEAFRQDTFKGYSIFKQQFCTRSKNVLLPESEFTDHY